MKKKAATAAIKNKLYSKIELKIKKRKKYYF